MHICNYLWKYIICIGKLGGCVNSKAEYDPPNCNLALVCQI